MKKSPHRAENEKAPADEIMIGKLDKASFDASLDRMLGILDEVNRELDELIAKTRP